MKRFIILFIAALFVLPFLSAQERVIFHQNNRILYEASTTEVDSIKLINQTSIFDSEKGLITIPFSAIDSITFSFETSQQAGDIIYILFKDDSVIITNPFEANGVSVTSDQGHVTLTKGNTGYFTHLICSVSGQTEDGSITIDNPDTVTLVLTNVSITNPQGSAILNATQAAVTIIQSEGYINHLSDGSGSSQNGTITTTGELIFDGEAQINLKGVKKHGIYSNTFIYVKNGTILISESASDGFHSEGFIMDNGILDITAQSDAIDAGAVALTINGGYIYITSTANDVKGIKSDQNVTINGGIIDMDISGAQSKGFSSKKDIIFNDGEATVKISGNTVLEASGSGYDPSYCTAFKSSGKISVNGGSIQIEGTSSNDGGKGFSADGNIEINDGHIQVTMSGNGATYTNENGEMDSYTSACIKSDENIYLKGGSIICSHTGTGGKGISADGALTIGEISASDSSLILTVTTSGERFYVSGSGDNADYANPKAAKSEGNLTVNSGIINITCSQSAEGGEGLESKDTLYIHGAQIDISAYDDCINASNHIEITGGTMHYVSRGNDAIDCNGTLSISGGFIIANGERSPEGGIDCDQSRFAVTGGIIIGTGGNNSTPTLNASTQPSISYTGSPGQAISITNSTGDIILLYTLPSYSSSSGSGPGGGNNNQMKILFSDPNFTVGSSYTLKYGGTISGGTTVNGYNTGGSYSGGASKAITINSMVTTVQ